jgi:aryl-alcohol dehydrogenase-like predicted oxidoreductase
MAAGSIPGLEQELSPIVMGTVRVRPALWEAYVRRGGRAFDTARHYGDESERELGTFLERHGLREQVVIVGKGAHTPSCRPDVVGPQLDRSLELLCTDHVDLYLLHRDNPSVPVGEFVDAVDEQVRAGRTRAVGVSNWTPERAEAFDAYAARHGRAQLACVSNQLSLAEMIRPVWNGCVRADPGWHERTGVPLLAWSAQARGFFAGRRNRDREVRRCWLSAANTERRRRAVELAGALGVSPVAVALAWLLGQPFPSFAVVGPRDERELDDCLAALDVDPAEVRGLDGPG